MSDLAELVAAFAGRLRAAGLAVGPDRATRFAAAVQVADPVTANDLYWCGRVTLLADPSEIRTYDAVFAEVFAGTTPLEPAESRSPAVRLRASTTDTTGGGGDHGEMEGEAYPALAAAAERLAQRDFATLSPDELAALTALMRRLRLATAPRPSRRFEAAARGRRVDLRTTLRRAQRTGGFPVHLARRRARPRLRRLVVLCDISGSMEPYARALLQLVYAAASSGGPRAEVFTFATRLTRLTKILAKVRPEVALERAGAAAPDWSGGTRIGEALKAFLDRYGARGMARGAVVLIISDGWETGDAQQLGRQMQRLSRLAYRIVWANPRTASPRYQPLVAGMAAAWPYCDAVVSAHSLVALDPLLHAIATPRG